MFHMKLPIVLVFVLVFHWGWASGDKRSPKIAIIGGGIGGTSVAYFLNELMPESNIHIFEKTGIIGGRLNVTMVFGNGYETGGSIIHPKNKYAVDLAKKFGLEQNVDWGESMSIVKNGEFVFNTSKWTIITIVKTLARYGFNVQRLESMVGGFLEKFNRIYDFQKDGKTFHSPEELLVTVDEALFNLTRVDFKSVLKEHNLSEIFIDELMRAITFVNYGQDLNIHGFAGSVSAAGTGSSLWSVLKGNKQIPEMLAKNSKAKIHFNTEVGEIIRLEDGSYKLADVSGRDLGVYDQIVLALPLDASPHLKFTNFETLPYDYPKSQKYHRTVATIVAGWTHPVLKFRSSIISCIPNWFNSISLLHPTLLYKSELYPVYKIFSSEIPTRQHLDTIFAERHHVESHDWLAYPEYDKIPPKFSNFVLAPRLYYLNAIEWAASAMEMSLISGKNIALLIAQDANNV